MVLGVWKHIKGDEKLRREYAKVFDIGIREAAEDLKQIWNLEPITGIKVSAEHYGNEIYPFITVQTKPLFSGDINIGSYTIKTSVEKNWGYLSVRNSDPIKSGTYWWHHSHFVSNDPDTEAFGCLGNATDVMHIDDFPVIISLLIEFLRNTANQNHRFWEGKGGTYSDNLNQEWEDE